jgi:hypothetical protein
MDECLIGHATDEGVDTLALVMFGSSLRFLEKH